MRCDPKSVKARRAILKPLLPALATTAGRKEMVLGS
jgi:hypothetical protein